MAVVIAAPASGSGKTLLSLVLVTLMLKKLLGGKHGESAGGRHDG